MSRLIERCLDAGCSLVVACGATGLLFPHNALLAKQPMLLAGSLVQLEPLRAELDLIASHAKGLPDSLEIAANSGRVFMLSKVPVGYEVREVGIEGVSRLLRWEDLQGVYLKTAQLRSSDALRLTLGGQRTLGGSDVVTLDIEQQSPTHLTAALAGEEGGFAATIRTSAPLDLVPADEGPLVSEKAIIVIVVSAAAVGAIACAVAAALTNCISDCSEGCALCGWAMQSSTEGYCGTCRCECVAPDGTPPVPNTRPGGEHTC